jgi:membrane-bound lytic murein transglycosylase B
MASATLAMFLMLSSSLSGRVAYVIDHLAQAGYSRREAEALFHNRHLRMYPERQVAPHNINWDEFITNINKPESIKRGQQFLTKNRGVLSEEERELGVEKEVLAALVRVETNFGKNTGKYVTFNVFYTSLMRSDDEARWKRAADNLVSLAVYCKRLHKDCFRIRGSYAGAIGLAQFLPHTLEIYGRDGDGDHIVDAFRTADAIFSAANFLLEHGWQTDQTNALAAYYGSPEGYPRAVLAYADTLRQSQVVQTGTSRATD